MNRIVNEHAERVERREEDSRVAEPRHVQEMTRVMDDVRNMRVLTPEQIDGLGELSKSQLMDLVELYNRILANIHFLFA